MNDVEAEYKYLRPSIERFQLTGVGRFSFAAGEEAILNFNREVNGVFSLPSLAVLYATICCTCTTVVLGSRFIFFNLFCDWCYDLH